MNTSIKTRKQIAIEYGISERTLRRYLKKFNIEIPTGHITPRYQELIYSTLGSPQLLLNEAQ